MGFRLTSYQRKLYEASSTGGIHLSTSSRTPLAEHTILKQICDHPDLVNLKESRVADVSKGEQDILSCKIPFINSLLDKLISEGRVLIFSQSCKMLDIIQGSLTRYEVLCIDGSCTHKFRQKTVEDFKTGTAPIFLLSSLVGGVGLTLTQADRVIVVDPSWNPSTDSQSVDRAYRIGQKNDVLVYRLITCGTIEEKIYRKQYLNSYLQTAKSRVLFRTHDQGVDSGNVTRAGFSNPTITT